MQVVLAPASAWKKEQGYSINRGQVVIARVTTGVGITKLIGKPRVKRIRAGTIPRDTTRLRSIPGEKEAN